MHVESACQLTYAAETGIYLVVLYADQAAEGYSGSLSKFGLRQQTILPQPLQVPTYFHDLNCRHLSPYFPVSLVSLLIL